MFGIESLKADICIYIYIYISIYECLSEVQNTPGVMLTQPQNIKFLSQTIPTKRGLLSLTLDSV